MDSAIKEFESRLRKIFFYCKVRENNGMVDVYLSADEFERVSFFETPLILLLDKAVSEGRYKDEWIPFPDAPHFPPDIIVKCRERVISLDKRVVESLDVILGLMRK